MEKLSELSKLPPKEQKKEKEKQEARRGVYDAAITLFKIVKKNKLEIIDYENHLDCIKRSQKSMEEYFIKDEERSKEDLIGVLEFSKLLKRIKEAEAVGCDYQSLSNVEISKAFHRIDDTAGEKVLGVLERLKRGNWQRN